MVDQNRAMRAELVRAGGPDYPVTAGIPDASSSDDDYDDEGEEEEEQEEEGTNTTNM